MFSYQFLFRERDNINILIDVERIWMEVLVSKAIEHAASYGIYFVNSHYS